MCEAMDEKKERTKLLSTTWDSVAAVFASVKPGQERPITARDSSSG